MSASNRQTTSTESLSVVVAVVAMAVVLVATVNVLMIGQPVGSGGILGDLRGTVAWVVVLAAVTFAGTQTNRFSIPFALTGVVILLFLADLLPAWATQPFAPLSEFAIGRQVSLDPVNVGVIVAVVIVGYWAFAVRVLGSAKKPSTVSKRVRARALFLVRDYLTVGRVVFGFVFATVFMFGSELGTALGELWTLVAGAPVISGYAATLAGGAGTFYLEVPVLGTLTPLQFGLIALVVFGLVVGVRFQEEGDL